MKVVKAIGLCIFDWIGNHIESNVGICPAPEKLKVVKLCFYEGTSYSLVQTHLL